MNLPFAALVLSQLLSTGGPPERGAPPEFKAAPCAAGFPTDVRCGSVEVPEDRSQPGRRVIALSVVVFPASGAEPVGAILSFSGGPGQAAARGSAFFARQVEPLRDANDFVFYDQRGTGDSNGLYCSLPPDPVEWFAEGVFSAPALADCRARLLERANIALYTTEESVADTRDVLDALGYDRVHLTGGSYGTRMAVAFAAAHPERVASMRLSGVVPPTVASVMGFSSTFAESVATLLDDCEADAACEAAYPEARQELDGLWERLDRGGVEATVTVADRQVVVPMDRAAFAYAMRGILYGPGAVALPRRIHEAAVTQSFDWFAQSYADRAQGIWAGLAIGMHLSAVCAEDAAHVPAGEAAKQRGPIRGLLLAEYLEACAVWDVPAADWSTLGESVKLDIPTLLLSGHRDPVTPDRYADMLMEQLTRGRSVVFPRGGHGYPGVAGACLAQIILQFARTLDPETLDDSCALGAPDPWDIPGG